jgi:hypothetical protein
MQVWQTPFCTAEYAARQPARSGLLGKIGNAELVRGISDLYALSHEIDSPAVSLQRYAALCQQTRRLFDAYHWLSHAQLTGLAPLLREITATAELVLDEYEKVESIRQQSAKAMQDAESRHKALLDSLLPDSWEQAQSFVDALNGITTQRGLLLTIREYRYIDLARLDVMEAELLAAQERVSAATATFLAGDAALQPFVSRLHSLDEQAQKAASVVQLAEPLAALKTMADGLAEDRRRYPAYTHRRIHLRDLCPPQPGQGACRTAAQGAGLGGERGAVRCAVQTVQPGHHQCLGAGAGPGALRRAAGPSAGAAGGTGEPVR